MSLHANFVISEQDDEKETKAAKNQVSAALSNKREMNYLVTCGYVQDRIFLNLVRAFSFMVWKRGGVQIKVSKFFIFSSMEYL